jgi:hypothetical protein
MRHLRDIYPYLSETSGKVVVPVEAYARELAKVNLDDDRLTTGNFKPGSSGESAFYKVLAGKTSPEELFEQPELSSSG